MRGIAVGLGVRLRGCRMSHEEEATALPERPAKPLPVNIFLDRHSNSSFVVLSATDSRQHLIRVLLDRGGDPVGHSVTFA